MSQEEINIWTGRLSKADHPYFERGHHLIHCGPNRTKRQRKGKFFLSAWTESSIFSCPLTLMLLVLGFQTQTGTYTINNSHPTTKFSGLQTQTELHHQQALLVLQLANGRIWDLASITVSTNSYTKSLLKYISIYLIVYVSLENWLIQPGSFNWPYTGLVSDILHTSLGIVIIIYLFIITHLCEISRLP